MDYIGELAVLVGYLTVIVGGIVGVCKGQKWFCKKFDHIQDEIDKMRNYSHKNYVNTLKLTIMSEDIPLEERLDAGERYVSEGGNGSVKARYDMLKEKYRREKRG